MLNNRPVICISTDSNQSSNDGTKPRQLISPLAYSAAIANAGAVPFLTTEHCAEEMAELCDALLLSGGDDVCPSLYNEEIFNDSVKPDPARTAYEVPLAKAFLAKGKPILTICRGFQLVNAIMGGNLYQDLVEQLGYVHMNGAIRHDIFAEEGSRLHRIFGKQFKVNSTHHQAIRDLAPGFHVTARSIEGLIEGYEHDTLPIWGTQFHPERLTGIQYDGRTPDFAPYFKDFVDFVRDFYAK
ncbi:MAG: hypothetical protein ABT01_01820 [Clostridium sp. SCN 57-10]|nr:MAG: hypothetical protein ABT01_01820 [Clostridium sp. SCN 57-10]